jgi:hypothetical protein
MLLLTKLDNSSMKDALVKIKLMVTAVQCLYILTNRGADTISHYLDERYS